MGLLVIQNSSGTPFSRQKMTASSSWLNPVDVMRFPMNEKERREKISMIGNIPSNEMNEKDDKEQFPIHRITLQIAGTSRSVN